MTIEDTPEPVALDKAYDAGYLGSERFWPSAPGSVLVWLEERGLLGSGRAWDVGCGEGTNANWLAGRGFFVEAIDSSSVAVSKARKLYRHPQIEWKHENVLGTAPPLLAYDLVVAYGLMHCIPEAEWGETLAKLQSSVAVGGLMVLVSFNGRRQELDAAHPGFSPTLKSHAEIQDSFRASWNLLTCTDADLHETHPHNGIPHTHSMTRLAARRTR